MPQTPHMDSPTDLETPETGGRIPGWLMETPYWAISAVAHLILLLAVGTVVLLQFEEEVIRKRAPEVSLAERRPPPPTQTTVIQNPNVLDKDRKLQKVVVTKKVEPVIQPPKGDPDKHSDHDNQDMLQSVFGSGGGNAGQHGYLDGLDRVAPSSGFPGQDAVVAALQWLTRHQHPDGYWSSEDFTVGCVDPKQPCANKNTKYGDGRGFAGYDVGVTGLAMLAFLGYGHTDQHGEHREFRLAMKKAKAWMLKQQVFSDDPTLNGVYGSRDTEEWIYNHAIATMAMAELLVITRDKFSKLPKSVQAATEYCLRAQNEGYGWKYNYKSGKNDSSVTGWMVLALKTAKACSAARLIKLRKDAYGKAFEGSINWFDRTTSSLSGVTGYTAPGDAGSQLNGVHPEPYPYSKELSCMTAVSTLCRLFAGQKRTNPQIKRGVDVLMKELPRWREAKGKRKSKVNIYYWYYGSYALFQFGGNKWKKWNDAMLETLIDNQRIGGDEHGSWDPVGEWGAAGGRVYSTALGAMTLEVYYRYRRLHGDS